MDLYLITGFLGAGKTTLLKNMAEIFSDKNLYFIINEFADNDVDSQILHDTKAEINSVAGGSIFCTCRLDRFEEYLAKAFDFKADIVIVEASGFSDPGSIRKILGLPAFKGIAYKGSICVADALNFEKVFATVKITKKQLAVSNMVLLNKCDLAPKEMVANVKNLIKTFNPLIKIYETYFCKIEKNWLLNCSAADNGDEIFKNKDLGLQKKSLCFKNISKMQLEKFVDMVAEDTYRIKGFVRCTDGLVHVEGVGPAVDISFYEKNVANDNCLNLLAGPGLKMEKSLKVAMEWYEGLVEILPAL